MDPSLFRRLTLLELEEVKPQFVRFLATQGIDGPGWEKTKARDVGRTDELLLAFSQMVFAGVIERVTYLVYRQAHELRTYHCGLERLSMLGLLIEGQSELDLRQTEVPAAEMVAALRSCGAQLKLYQAERTYRAHGRAQDIFLLMEEGALISDGSLYELLKQV
ncbi:MAG: hypothetical protein HC821_01700 [Lewinella sp.]|nr:hypothetical protein [Lewinella sp.]